MTRSMVELAGFKHFVESQPTETTKKIFLYALAERWWDTTLTFHIASLEMMITPYDIYRLTGLRWTGSPLLSALFQHTFELIGSILVWIWERQQPTSLVFCKLLLLLLRTRLRKLLGWQGPFSCT
jgi:hypothetical protein